MVGLRNLKRNQEKPPGTPLGSSGETDLTIELSRGTTEFIRDIAGKLSGGTIVNGVTIGILLFESIVDVFKDKGFTKERKNVSGTERN